MKAIMDTGPWVALIDKSESAHEKCLQWFKDFEGEIYSSEAVLTEVLFLLNFSIKAQKAAIDFIIKSIVEIIPSNHESLVSIKILMEKYSDLPMDFADATLVSLAQDSGIQNIITLDSHFGIYRFNKNKSFILHPTP